MVIWVMAILCLCPKSTLGVSLQWDRNSEPTVAGYRVYLGQQSRNYTTTFDAGNQTLAEVPPLQAGRTYYFAVTAYDGQGLESDLSQEVFYTVPGAPVTNSPPLANPDIFVTSANVSFTVPAGGGVLQNDLDAEHDVLVASLVSNPGHGLVTLQPDGAFTYIPATDFVGLDSFSYRARDGQTTSAVATVTIVMVNEGKSGGCPECLVPLRQLLLDRGSTLAEVLAPPVTVPTNSTCLEMELRAFYSATRKIGRPRDAEMASALLSAAHCLAANLQQAMSARTNQVGELLPSSWLVAASNSVGQARRKLDAVGASTNAMKSASSLRAVLATLKQIDRFVKYGNLAPESVSNRIISSKFTFDGSSFRGNFLFQETTFVFTDEGGQQRLGTYTFNRTAWNAGTLLLHFEGPMDMTLNLKFGRTLGSISGTPDIRGTFSIPY